MATKVLAINLRFGFCFLQWASDRIHEPESINSGYAVCTKHLSWMTALSKMIFDKQLAALGQRQNQICSLKPADSKKAAWTLRSIQLWSHSVKGAKRVIQCLELRNI